LAYGGIGSVGYALELLGELSVGVIMELEPFTRELLSEDYEGDEYFRKLKERPTTSMEGNEYHLQYGMLYNLNKLYIPQYKRVQFMREAHTSRVARHFGVTKIVENMKRCAYWLNM
jgi:hypothetical protein